MAFRSSGLTVSCLAACVAAQSVLDLSSFSWHISNPTGNISVPASFPSQAHLDLYEQGIIPYPQFGLGDFDLRWVAYSNWTYSANLTGLDKSDESTWLLFNGLDTFTSIEFCGTHVASTNNQFRQYYFDVTDILNSCTSDPTLSIDFGSAPNIANDLRNAPGAEKWPFSVEITYEFYGRQFIRKEQSDFGWDWGPAYAPAGPWQPGYVVQLPTSALSVRNTLLDIYRLGQLNNLPPDQTQPWVVNASLDVLGTIPEDASITYQIMDLKNKTVASGPLTNITSSTSTISGSVIVDGEAYQLWWPNGLGPQNLYYITVNIVSGNKTLASSTKRTGFRTVVLNMEPISDKQLSQNISPGNNWHFEINGHEFYTKGSNFIPPSPFWANVSDTDIRNLFEAVVEGNQNMLRVWASGAYSPSFIYDLADELGILLWSEFEFGDSLYPVDDAFLENVAEEVNYNVRRVNHHPSLALWAGGNELENLELELALEYDPGNITKWVSQYEKLFLHTILPIVYGNTKSVSYIPSSTTNGYVYLNVTNDTMIERYNNLTAGYTYGDTDHYDYDSTVAFNLSSYPVGRFANEFGFHSMPSLETWEGSVAAEDLTFNSTTILLRNHHDPAGSPAENNFANSTKGMGEMTIAAQLYYPTPDKTNSIANFSAWCLTTQIFQADFYRSQITYYRRGSGLKERQLGSLYWQLEDLWAAPTWAGIESTGRWKFLHYVAKDIYQPIIIAPYWNYTTGDLTAYVTSDLWSQASGDATFTWYDYSGNVLSSPSSAAFSVGALNTTKVLQLNTNNLTFANNNAVLKLNLTATGSKPNTNTSTDFAHEFWFHPTWLSEAKLVDPGLTLTYNNASEKFVVEATTGVAAWVWLDWPGVNGHFEANGFWLGKGEVKEVGFVGGNSDPNVVTVSSLFDNTVS